MRFALLGLLVAASLLVAGCTHPPNLSFNPSTWPPPSPPVPPSPRPLGPSAATPAPSATPPGPSPAPASPAPAAGGATVKILPNAILAAGDPAKSWSQPELHIKAGTTVTWENDDTVPHDVTFVSGPEKPNSGGPGNIEPGKSWSHTFTAPGTYIYECSIHVTLMNKPGVGPEVFVE